MGSKADKLNGLGINLGIEKHFKGSERLSPYADVGPNFRLISSKGSRIYINYDENTQNYNNGNQFTSKIIYPHDLTFVLRGVLGPDYYFTQGLYLGVEAGLGMQFSKAGKNEVTDHAGNSSSNSNTYKGRELRHFIISAPRIGFNF